MRAQDGFTYLGLLLAVVVLGIALAEAGVVWRIELRREREAQLLYIGDQYRRAIGRYLAAGGTFPRQLEDLVTDMRAPVPRHFLRRLYPDPMTGQADWLLIEAPGNGGILGVASSSQEIPIKRTGFEMRYATFEDAQCYCAWQFVYSTRRYPRSAVPAAAPAAAPADAQ
jgi:type II secretory pathway pseudopilin PulG